MTGYTWGIQKKFKSRFFFLFIPLYTFLPPLHEIGTYRMLC